MSDQTGLVSLPNTLNLDEVRAAVLEALGRCRLKTVVRYTSGGPYTLDGTVDQVWVAGTLTVNLPAAPNDGDTYDFLQETNGATLTIGRNGKNIDGAASDTTVVGGASNVWKTLTWSASANTWRTR